MFVYLQVAIKYLGFRIYEFVTVEQHPNGELINRLTSFQKIQGLNGKQPRATIPQNQVGSFKWNL